MSTSTFILNIKPGGHDMVPEALAAEQLIIGWDAAEGLLDQTLDWEQFRWIIQRAHYDGELDLRKAGQATRSLWNFVREMKHGDYVVVPHGKLEFFVGRVAGGVVYDSTVKLGRYRRSVVWLNGKKPFARALAPQSIQWGMVARGACQGWSNITDLLEKYLEAQGVGCAVREQLALDITEIEARYRDEPTTRNAMVACRLGQGAFREEVLENWGGSCAVTGVRVVEAIRASHIKPWRFSTDRERLDSRNGLPLVATLDALFDCGLISFADDGGMLVSPQCLSSEIKKMGIPSALRRLPGDAERQFLDFHRRAIFRKI